MKKDSQWMVELLLNGSPVSFKVDTGADVTVVPEKTFKSIKGSELRPAETALYGPNRQRIPSLGQATMVLQKGDKEIKEEVFVVPQADQALLGKPAIEALGLLQRIDIVNEEDYVTVIKQRYPKLFQGLGKLAGKYKIRLKEDAKPIALSAPRRIAVPLLPKVKKELQRMESLGVISKQTEPTKWCSGIVVVPKSNDQVRICVDLTQLNESVYRERHVLPTVEQVLAHISGARYFSKLDANSGFWQVPLDKESSPLTTFVTPFGRYRFNRLPFGITSAPEHFQRRMMELLGDLQGVVCLIDDVLVHGSTKDGHNQNLDAVLKRMQEANLTLNEEKCQFCTTEVHFLGQIVDVSGVRPDPEKVAAIQNFPKPTCVGDIRRFLGMVNQLNKFTPNLADKTKPLNDLLVKKNQWVWGDVQQKAFSKVKESLTTTPVLALYDPTKPTTVSADASAFGLGAVLMQDDPDKGRRPVAYISRTMSPTESRYAQIEKEALSITWACDRFSEFLIGMEFEIQTDHKPLVPLLRTKQLDDLPPRILRFRLRLMRYQFSIYHVPGKNLVTADALSRAPSSEATEEDNSLQEEVEAYVRLV